MVAGGKAVRWDARTKLGSCKRALHEGGNYQQEAATMMRSGCTHDVLKCLPGQRCAVEMRDGQGKGEVGARQLRR
jgi:hypothetical protein